LAIADSVNLLGRSQGIHVYSGSRDIWRSQTQPIDRRTYQIIDLINEYSNRSSLPDRHFRLPRRRPANPPQRGIEAYILNPETDGIAQISRILAHRPADSLTLVAHGFPGGLQLGAGTLELGNLHRYTEQLQTWFDSQSGKGGAVETAATDAKPTCVGLSTQSAQADLAPVAAISHRPGKDGAVETAATDTKPTCVGLSTQSAQADLAPVAAISHRPGVKLKPQLTLLACQVAAGDAGAEFIEQLQTLTSARIAASTQPIGNGNWNLDTQIGSPCSPWVFTTAVRKAYAGVLGLVLKGSYDTPGSARGVSVVGNLAYVVDVSSGLQILFNNTLPTAADTSLTTPPDTAYAFTATSFNFTDLDGDALAQVQVTQLETQGQLFLDSDGDSTEDSGEAITLNQTIPIANLAGLKQISPPNQAKSCFMCGKNVPIGVEPQDKSIR
jgi:hypothetical protein